MTGAALAVDLHTPLPVKLRVLKLLMRGDDLLPEGIAEGAMLMVTGPEQRLLAPRPSFELPDLSILLMAASGVPQNACHDAILLRASMEKSVPPDATAGKLVDLMVSREVA